MIPTLEGDMLVRPGDYIIKGVQGEFYPCKPDIFEQTYEEVDGKSEWHDDPCCPNCKSDKHGHVREYPDCCCLVGIARSEG